MRSRRRCDTDEGAKGVLSGGAGAIPGLKQESCQPRSVLPACNAMRSIAGRRVVREMDGGVEVTDPGRSEVRTENRNGHLDTALRLDGDGVARMECPAVREWSR